MDFKPTNEQITLEILTEIITELKNIIPDFPDTSNKTISYSFDSENDVISFTWGEGYKTSEDWGLYVLDLDSDGDIIGVELLNFKIVNTLN